MPDSVALLLLAAAPARARSVTLVQSGEGPTR